MSSTMTRSALGGTICVAMAAVGAGSAAATTGYTVGTGDTLARVAAAHHTTRQALARINHLSNPNLIRTGQRLSLGRAPVAPARKSAPPAATSYHGYPIEPGTYVEWKKSANLVFLVRNGTVVRSMPTTDLDWKTPVGNYRVQVKIRHGGAYDQGHDWTLNYFVGYGTVPGHTGIAFHEVPVRGRNTFIQPLSTVGKDATYQSHGCERLLPADALAVWNFTRIGTEVRVR